MTVHKINPVTDRRWQDFVASHQRSSIFHQPCWLEALWRTYNYEPFALTSAAPGEALQNGIVFCRVSSWMTGTRLVSLPFTDHCEPLLGHSTELSEFAGWLSEQCREKHWDYAEIRQLDGDGRVDPSLSPGRAFWFHELDLQPSLEQLFRQMHHNSFRRKIRRAERENLAFEAGRSEELLEAFDHLLLMTRRRQQLLPQPKAWFRNLMDSLGEKLQISVARKNHAAVAAMITLRHQSTVVYKYGCSDERFHNLGGMPFLFWKLVEASKQSGAERIDLGRSDVENEGLIVFKDRLGARKRKLTYLRYTNVEAAMASKVAAHRRVQGLSSVLPDSILSVAGRLLYRHMG